MVNAVRYRVRTPKDTPPYFAIFCRVLRHLNAYLSAFVKIATNDHDALYWLKTALNGFDVFPLALFHADHRHVQKLTGNAFWYKND